jgi:hypothetical protein
MWTFHSEIKDYPAWYIKIAIKLHPLILFEKYLNSIDRGLILKMVVPILFEVFSSLE